MPVLKLEIDIDSFNHLAEIAVNERRPIPLQAEVLLLKAIDRWPVPDYPRPVVGTLSLQKPTEMPG